MAADIEHVLLQRLADQGAVADSGVFATELQEDHLKVVGVIKSLEMAEMIAVKVVRGVCFGGWGWEQSVSPHTSSKAVRCGLAHNWLGIKQ
jgi:hypothetical protein